MAELQVFPAASTAAPKRRTVAESFPVTDQEWQLLEKEFGDLALFASWDLLKKNTSNNHTLGDLDDVVQELRIAAFSSACYFKRQTYIEDCLRVCARHVVGDVARKILEQLEYLWQNKTRHGAGRSTFGYYHDCLLEDLVRCYVPADERPDRRRPLEVNKRFRVYCKSIVWNRQRTLGKGITRSKVLRNSCVSLSEFDHLAFVG